jgi:hypothetical protein
VVQLDSLTARLDRAALTLTGASGSLETVLGRVERGEGTLGQLSTSDSLYVNMNSTVAALNELITDIREDPRRYFTVGCSESGWGRGKPPPALALAFAFALSLGGGHAGHSAHPPHDPHPHQCPFSLALALSLGGGHSVPSATRRMTGTPTSAPFPSPVPCHSAAAPPSPPPNHRMTGTASSSPISTACR